MASEDEHEVEHAHAHDHEHGNPPQGGSWGAIADSLVADATMFLPVLNAAITHVQDVLGTTPVNRILDFGSGPGVTTVALAGRFPEARVIAADGSPELLAMVHARAVEAGVADRVETLHTDLAGSPVSAAASFDLVWASMVIHHFDDPLLTLTRMAEGMAPGGVLAVVEFGSPLTMFPAEDEGSRSGTWDRVREASAQALRQHLPHAAATDWADAVRGAGFEVAAIHDCVLDVPAPLPATHREWLRHRLSRDRQTSADVLGADDLAALDRVIDPGGSGGVLAREDVFIRTSRALYVGRRPRAGRERR